MSLPFPQKNLSRKITYVIFAASAVTAAQAARAQSAARTETSAAPVTQPASSQSSSPSSVATLSAITAQSEGLETEGSQSYGASGVSVFKTTQTLRETPHPVTVLTRKALDDQFLPDLQDVMRASPGITVDFVDTERVNYYSRGYQIDAIQLDGLTMQNNGSSFLQPDTAVLDRVEIIRGAGGMLRGSGNPSATVNLVRKLPTSDLRASAALTFGSWNRRRMEADISTALIPSGKVRGRLIAVSDDRDFFQDVRQEKRKLIYGVVQADLTPNTLLTASVQHTDLNATGAWGNLPRGLDGSDLGLPRSTYLGSDWNEWNRWNQQFFGSLEHRFNDDWKATFSVAHTVNHLKDFKQSYFSRVKNQPNPYLFTVTSAEYGGDETVQDNFSLTVNGAFKAFGRRHEVVLGAEQINNRNKGSVGMGNLYPTIVDIRDWDPHSGQPPEPFVDTSGEQTVTYIRQKGLYGTLRMSLADPLTAIIGGRFSWWENKTKNNSSKDYKIKREFTPYAGLVLDLNDNLSAYASYTEIFTPQNYRDASGTILKPVRGEDYELGIKGEFLEGRLNAALSLFRINNVGKAMEDVSSPFPCTPYYTSSYCYAAGGKTRSQGWELEMSGEIMPGWQVMGGYTNTSTKYIRDSNESNVGLPLRTLDPKHMLRLFTSYTFNGGTLDGLTLGAGVRAQSATYAQSGNVRAEQGGYAVYNAMAGYQINKNLRLQLNVNNIFDKTYYHKVDAAGISNYYGDPRNVMLTLQARL